MSHAVFSGGFYAIWDAQVYLHGAGWRVLTLTFYIQKAIPMPAASLFRLVSANTSKGTCALERPQLRVWTE